MLSHLLHAVAGDDNGNKKMKPEKIKGTVILMKKNVLDFNDFHASFLDGFHELLGKRVSFQLISSQQVDADNGLQGKLGKEAYLEDWNSTETSAVAGESKFDVNFDFEEEIGLPGAFLIRNNHHSEFYLKTLTLEHVPGHGRLHFVCNSWVYPDKKYDNPRVFFTNKPKTESRIPLLMSLNIYVPRDERFGHLKMSDFLAYALKSIVQFIVPELQDLTDKTHNEFDSLEDVLKLYYGGVKLPSGPLLDNIINNIPLEMLKEIFRTDEAQLLKFPVPQVIQDSKTAWRTDEEFAREMLAGVNPVIIRLLQEFPPKSNLDPKVYGNQNSAITKEHIEHNLEGLTVEKTYLPHEMPKPLLQYREQELMALRGNGQGELQESDRIYDYAYYNDLGNPDKGPEYARPVLGGSAKYPYPRRGRTGRPPAKSALRTNRLFILDHHDSLMPYLRRINTTTTKTYASRTILLLRNDGTLKPLVIELSLPHSDGDQLGAVSKVYTPTEHGVEGSIWQLAKAYVAVNDSGVHQLISHWLNTHATMEPFVIATNRQLSVVHPIYKLLYPHFRDTMNINAFARQILINGGGVLELTVFPGKYAMEMSSIIYKSWNLFDQALPRDLKKRGVAVDDKSSPNGLRLLIKDYPYAVDGLEIWFAIEKWVKDYCSFYYKTDEMVQQDSELQAWWKELREEGHGDKKDEPWWPKMQTREELINSCTIIIWVASALHAAVNFGQYPYAGYLPNRPTISRRFMPEKGTPEYTELESNPDKVFLKTITAQLQTLLGISLIEILSRHSSDEVYLGQRANLEWTSDETPLAAFDEFGKRLTEIEERIVEMNNDEQLKNRVGPVNMPYTLLYPTSEGGLTGKGIPNSVSI
ncbi:hypothetical protein GOBAR_AA09130 [Gossypium barbadense]|uniref:Lipoxygenase n=1 Tax=Gossypium barbadense TaxID=3634 RepID=A0A2P5Y7I6_GOSBA|nr:hypothetical protein GOBAR_AA09130 [Gossypium barbadense]